MIFTYKPEGETRTWNVKPGKLLSPEMEAIERTTGVLYPEWNELLLKGSASAVHALLWILLRRDTPGLKYDDVEFGYDDFDLEFDLDEKAEIVANYDAAIAAGEEAPAEYVSLMEDYRADLPPVAELEVVDLDAIEDPETYVPAPKGPASPGSSSANGMSGTLHSISPRPPLTGTA